MSKVTELDVGMSQNKPAYHWIFFSLLFSYTNLIFHLGQIEILGKDNKSFKKKNAPPCQICDINKEFWVFRQK